MMASPPLSVTHPSHECRSPACGKTKQQNNNKGCHVGGPPGAQTLYFARAQQGLCIAKHGAVHPWAHAWLTSGWDLSFWLRTLILNMLLGGWPAWLLGGPFGAGNTSQDLPGPWLLFFQYHLEWVHLALIRESFLVGILGLKRINFFYAAKCQPCIFLAHRGTFICATIRDKGVCP
jgi:hypothetical protein